MREFGLVFVALDSMLYHAMTVMSIVSLRLSANEEPVTVITNLPAELWVGQTELNYQTLPVGKSAENGTVRSGSLKSDLLSYSPYVTTLFVDPDVLFLGSIRGIWEGEEDVCAAIDACQTIGIVRLVEPSWGSPAAWKNTVALVGEDGSHYNVGIFRLRSSSATTNFLSLWRAEINKSSPPDIDQIAFMRALHHSNISFKTMEPQYNYSHRRFHIDQITMNCPTVLHFNGIPSQIKTRLMLNIFERHFSKDRP
jgi:Nucleotide-diphospho-sugar transferase